MKTIVDCLGFTMSIIYKNILMSVPLLILANNGIQLLGGWQEGTWG